MPLASRTVDRVSRLTVPELIVVGVILLVSDQAVTRIGSNQLLADLADGLVWCGRPSEGQSLAADLLAGGCSPTRQWPACLAATPRAPRSSD
jgi:hypothetical protein